jgi:L-alanine-DL-glutamate epimerase-like enolase superfamily enzyme
LAKPTDIRIRDARLEIEYLSFRTPLKFGGRVVEHYQVVNVWIDVENRVGDLGTGLGSMPIGNIWAWPTTLEPDQTQAAMRTLSEELTREVATWNDFAHAIDHGVRLAETLEKKSADVVVGLNLPEPMPRLASLVAASPIDAAIHDAFGHCLRANVYQLLGPDHVERDLSHYLSKEFAGEFLDRYTLREPKDAMPLYHLVGALDPLSPADITKPVQDGLPETLGDWIGFNGLTHLKIKLSGDQMDWDVARVAAVEQVAVEAQAKRGCVDWHYSLDFNEKCASVDYVLEFLERVRFASPQALDRVQYIEQPTHRDLKTRGTSIEKAARIKPVVIDESLVDFESLLLARELGYTGVALKACKGQTESLLMAAAAQKFGMFLCVQDLTCPGASFLHSAGLAARIPGIAAIEGNGRQYCPAGNTLWEEEFPSMFLITRGTIGTHCLTRDGLGHTST